MILLLKVLQVILNGKNNFYFNKDFKNKDKKRFEKLNISLKELNNNGEYIVLSEPSRLSLFFRHS